MGQSKERVTTIEETLEGIDLEIFKMSRIQCTIEDMAVLTGLTVDVFYNKYHRLVAMGRSDGRKALLAAQHESAFVAKDTGMQKWLGIQFLKQLHKIEGKHSVEGNITYVAEWGTTEREETETVYASQRAAHAPSKHGKVQGSSVGQASGQDDSVTE